MKPYSVHFYGGAYSTPQYFRDLTDANFFARLRVRHHSYALIEYGGDSVELLFGQKVNG